MHFRVLAQPLAPALHFLLALHMMEFHDCPRRRRTPQRALEQWQAESSAGETRRITTLQEFPHYEGFLWHLSIKAHYFNGFFILFPLSFVVLFDIMGAWQFWTACTSDPFRVADRTCVHVAISLQMSRTCCGVLMSGHTCSADGGSLVLVICNVFGVHVYP